MYYSVINPHDIANGTGVRVSLFTSGCHHHCKNCFNPETWDFKYGSEFTEDSLNTLIECLTPDYISGLSILGGDPLSPENIDEVLKIVKAINIHQSAGQQKIRGQANDKGHNRSKAAFLRQ